MAKVREKEKPTQYYDNGIPYIVTHNGQVLCQTSESLRYPADIELQMLDAGYVITIAGKKLTKKATQERIAQGKN